MTMSDKFPWIEVMIILVAAFLVWAVACFAWMAVHAEPLHKRKQLLCAPSGLESIGEILAMALGALIVCLVVL